MSQDDRHVIWQRLILSSGRSLRIPTIFGFFAPSIVLHIEQLGCSAVSESAGLVSQSPTRAAIFPGLKSRTASNMVGSDSMRMHSSLETVDHRPWPLPQQKWKWRQSWLDLAFIHYRVLPEDLRDLLPDGIQLQEFDGSAWIGIVPFRMANVTRRSLPSVPYLSAFPELNLRTYVEVNGKPGVWFLSLDAASLPFVMAARRLYRLPYFFARIRAKQTEGWINFSSVRSGGVVRFEAKYRPVGEVFYATEGTFEHWATERYCLYSSPRDGEMTRVEVHHAPWPLQEAELVVEKNNLMSARGISAVEGEPVCHFSSGVHVISFGGEAIARGRELQVKDN